MKKMVDIKWLTTGKKIGRMLKMIDDPESMHVIRNYWHIE
ncbi:MAG: hypothetical protein FD181_597 [Prolixibacteraceae bacterium]|nr:MAG: hypothetical protein FD181_597 [Prolixibacteraceae bacterium]